MMTHKLATMPSVSLVTTLRVFWQIMGLFGNSFQVLLFKMM